MLMIVIVGLICFAAGAAVCHVLTYLALGRQDAPRASGSNWRPPAEG
jgi:hypothetical protein